MNIGLAAYKLSFQLSPIILVNGLAQDIPGGMLPIIALTEAINFTKGLLFGANINLDDFFANFEPMAGATMLEQQIGKYPFANQTVAANAVIPQPLTISMKMLCPARGELGYLTKLPTMIALQKALSDHNNTGGLYTVLTPSYFYTNCIMTAMRDISDGSTKQPQFMWQMDFEQPLVTESQAEQAQNSLMGKISGGLPIDGQPAWSGPQSAVGSTYGLVTPSLIPAASNTAGTGIAGAANLIPQ